MEDRFEEISNRFDDDRIIIKLAELRVIGFIFFFFFEDMFLRFVLIFIFG